MAVSQYRNQYDDSPGLVVSSVSRLGDYEHGDPGCEFMVIQSPVIVASPLPVLFT